MNDKSLIFSEIVFQIYFFFLFLSVYYNSSRWWKSGVTITIHFFKSGILSLKMSHCKMTRHVFPFADVNDIPATLIDELWHGIQDIPIQRWTPSVMFGKSSRRLQCTYGSSDYKFANTIFRAGAIDSVRGLSAMIAYLSHRFKVTFDMVHLNQYPQQDQDVVNPAKLGWHSDDEGLIQSNTPIVGISFGYPQQFGLRSKQTHSMKLLRLTAHKTTYVMLAGCQLTHEHCVVPLTKLQKRQVTEPFGGIRFSVTFRCLASH
jgi:hypothetical protein